jgi:hypothetical protein
MLRKVMDAVVLLALAVGVCFGAWLCSHTEGAVRPDESDCIAELRAATRKTTNFTEAEMVTYGRCLAERRE